MAGHGLAMHRSNVILVVGWLFGVMVATLGNYLLIPVITLKTGQRTTAMAIGLGLGVVVMYVSVIAAQYLAKRVKKQAGAAILAKIKRGCGVWIRPKAMVSFIIIFLVFALLVTSGLGKYLSDIFLTDKQNRSSHTIVIGFGLGVILMLYAIYGLMGWENNAPYQRKDARALAQKSERRRVVYLLLLILPLSLAGAFILWEAVIKPNQPVARIRLEKGKVYRITTREFLKRLRYEQERKQATDTASSHTGVTGGLGFAGAVLERMTREVQVEDLAKRRGIQANEKEIDAEIRRNQTKEKNPSLKARPVQHYNLTDVEFRKLYKTEVLGKKLREAFFRAIPVKQEQVRLKFIRFERRVDAQRAVSGNWNAVAFERLYERIGQGEVGSATGMVRDWSSLSELKKDFNSNFGKKAYQLAPGQCFIRPEPASRGWYLVKALEHKSRALPEEWRRQQGDNVYQDWMIGQQVNVTQYSIWMKRIPQSAGTAKLVLDTQPAPNTLWDW